MSEAAQNQPTPAPDGKAQELQRAFDVFNQVSLELAQAYAGLQAKVESLTAELATANGELRRQYQEKEALSERLSLLLAALPAGVVVLDAAGCVEEANPAAGAMLGESLPGADWSQLAQSHLAPTEAPDEWQLAARRVAIAESALDSAGGRLLLINDVTVAHRLKTDLERNQRLAAMGEMAASLAHQLRTPLATALLYSANLGQPGLAEAARVRFADKATAQLRRLERLIQDVLLFARGESIGRELIVASQWLAEAAQTLEPLCAEKGVTLSVLIETGDSIIMGGRKALDGALLNLLENALQVCEPGGQVSLSASVAERRLRVGVRDTGPGIAPEVQSRIFEPFFTTRGQGTGLGLAIALGVVRAHAGTLSVRSALGAGSEFLMDLPAGEVAGSDVDAS
ncbi:PAS domain-containing protein [Rhodocyclus tenuis]|uniref:histidine kinase n=2 Tax=Rhodocyclus TaxID=1064 RepID=A0A6L5JY53_RHOTE|nr:PAS domain-containing sensor histidine kinase [Rhodocyclus gracilis]MQY51584.1 PAS domain-containing protein [Rhodocyclus gracilis]NJA89156.1 PAS domain-containing protein [Rhodocyclus gracilis]